MKYKKIVFGALAVGLFWVAPEAKADYPISELRSVLSGDERKIDQIREQEIRELTVLLGRRPPKNRRADLYYRLAEAYIDAYRTWNLAESKLFEKRLESRPQGSGYQAKVDHGFSKTYLIKGLKVSRELLQLAQNSGAGSFYSKLDKVYFFMAFNSQELGDRKAAGFYYRELVKKFPSSAFASESLRELGDDAFYAREYRAARVYYQSALQKSAPELKARLRHKLAWTYYRTKDYTQAVEEMKRAVEDAANNGEKYLALKEEALRDLALFMVESGQSEDAVAYFESLGLQDPEFLPKALERLAIQQDKANEKQRSLKTSERLLQVAPRTGAGLRALMRLVESDLASDRVDLAGERLRQNAWVSDWIPSQPNASGTESLPVDEEGDSSTEGYSDIQLALALKALVRKTATSAHNEARKGEVIAKEKSKSPPKKLNADQIKKRLAKAKTLYSLYLEVFLAQKDPRAETTEIEMYLAEVEQDLGNSQGAAELYKKVVAKKDAKYSVQAARLLTASLADAIKSTSAEQREEEKDQPSKLEQEFVESSDLLVKTAERNGQPREALEARLRAAQVLAGYISTRKTAQKRLDQLIEDAPDSPQSLTAALLVLQLKSEDSVREKDSGLLSKKVREFQANKVLLENDSKNGGKLALSIKELDQKVKIQKIAEDESSENFEKAAEGYEAFARESRDPQLAETAYANAVASYSKANRYQKASSVADSWLLRFPKSKKAFENLRSLATLSLIQGSFETAAKLFERLGKEDSELQVETLETAARILEGLDLEIVDGKTISKTQNVADVARLRALSIRSMVKNKNTPPAKIDVSRLELARYLDQKGRDRDANRAYQDCIKNAAPTPVGKRIALECQVRLGLLFERSRDLEQAKSHWQKAAQSQGGPEAMTWIGYARFLLAQEKQKSTRLLPLSLPENQLKKAVTQRLEFFEILSKEYLKAVDAGGPFAIASLDALAFFAAQFANDLDAIAAPEGSSPKAIENFKKSLASVSSPLRKKAIETWTQAYSKAVVGESLSPALPGLVDHLGDRRVSFPRRAQGPRGRFRISGVPANDSKSMERVRSNLAKDPKQTDIWVDYGNLIWGEGKPLLAMLAYDRALALDPQNLSAQNNRTVVAVSGDQENDWREAAEAEASFAQISKRDPFYIPAKVNRALLFNYYRLFAKSKSLWESLVVKAPSADVWDGLAVAHLGLGDPSMAQDSLKEASKLGAEKKRFVPLMVEASEAFHENDLKKCRSRASDLSDLNPKGFEKDFTEHLFKICEGNSL